MVMVVDDGSQDDTGTRARHAGACVIRHETSQGASASRHAGVMALAAWDAVAFLDADDEYLPGFLASSTRALKQTPGASLVFGQAVERRADGTWRRPRPFPQEHLHQPLWGLAWSNLIPTSATVVPQWAYNKSGGFSWHMGSCAEDYDLWLRLALLGPFATTQQAGVLRHVDDASFSRRESALDSMRDLGLKAVNRNRPAIAQQAPWFPRIATGHILRESARRSLATGRAKRAKTEAMSALRCNPADAGAWAVLAAATVPPSLVCGAAHLLGRWSRDGD
jgi:glycosyltransferase involved in cell wall biosynthesis